MFTFNQLVGLVCLELQITEVLFVLKVMLQKLFINGCDKVVELLGVA